MLRSAQHDMQESSRDFVKAVVIPGFQDLLKLREPAQALLWVSRKEASGGGDKRELQPGDQSEDEEIAFRTARFSQSVLSSGWNAARNVTTAATNKALKSHLLTAPEIACEMGTNPVLDNIRRLIIRPSISLGSAFISMIDLSTTGQVSLCQASQRSIR